MRQRAAVVACATLTIVYAAPLRCGGSGESGSHVTIDTLDRQIVVQNTADGLSMVPHMRGELTAVPLGLQLDDPRAVFPWDDTSVIVLDLDQLKIVTPHSNHQTALGRLGEGPGEYRQVTGVAVWPPDSLAVWDPRLGRVSILAPTGAVVRAITILPPGRFSNPPRVPSQLASWSSGIVLPWFGPLFIGGQREMVLAWTSLSGDSIYGLTTLEEETSEFVGGVVFPKDPFGPRATVGANGRFLGYTDGVDYCIEIVSAPPQLPRRVCKDWQRVPVMGSVAHPHVEALASDLQMNPTSRAVLRARVQGQEVGELRNSINRLLVQHDGGFWVQVADRREKEFDRLLMMEYASYRPDSLRWDLYDSIGRWTATADVPAAFEPWIVTSTGAVGVLELPSGVRTLAHLTLRGDE